MTTPGERDGRSAGAGRSRVALPVALRSLRHRDFRLFFAGQVVSLTGAWMQSVAQAWLAYRLTGSAVLLGWVGFAGQIPAFLLAPVGGALADRFDRRWTLILTQGASMALAFGLAGLTLAGRVGIEQVIGFAAALGIVNAFDIPARQAFVVDMVGREDLLNAIALNSSVFNGARVVGPALAGVLVGRIGEGWCFFANGASYLAVIAGLLAMRVARKPRAAAAEGVLERVAAGFRHVAGSRPVRALLLLLGLVSLTGMPYAVLMPVFASEILHGGARGLGILMGATGVGALAAAITLARRTGIRGLGSWVAAAAGGFGLALVLFSNSTSFWLSVALLVPVGYCMVLQMAVSNTLVQSLVPDRLRGRVMAVYTMMFFGMAPLGALTAGVLAGRIGAPATVAVGGVACMAGAVVFRLRLPRLRSEARRLVIALQMAAGDPAEEAAAAPPPGTDTGIRPESTVLDRSEGRSRPAGDEPGPPAWPRS